MGGANPVPTLSNGTVSLPSGFGNALAQVVAELLATIQAGQQAIKSANLTSIKPLSSLNSGSQLADRFSKQGSALSQLMDDNVTILNDLGPAFIAAEQAYQDATEAAAREFKKIQKDSTLGTSGPPPSYNPNATQGAVPKAPPHKFVPGQNGVPNNHDPVSAEPGSALSLSEMQAFAQHGQNIPAYEQAQTWNWLGSGLNKAANDFMSGLTNGSSEWNGSGKDTAMAACQGYAQSLQQLATEVSQVGNAMQYAVWQIDQAISAMAAALAEWDGKNDNTATTARNNGVHIITNAYDPGVTYSSEGIPAALTSPKNPLANPIDSNKPKNLTTQSPGGSGGGSGNASYSPSASSGASGVGNGDGGGGGGNGGGGGGNSPYGGGLSTGGSYNPGGGGLTYNRTAASMGTPSSVGSTYYAAMTSMAPTSGPGSVYPANARSFTSGSISGSMRAARSYGTGSSGSTEGSYGAGSSGVGAVGSGVGHFAGNTSGSGHSSIKLTAGSTSGAAGSVYTYYSASASGMGSSSYGFGGVSGSGAGSGSSLLQELVALATSLVQEATSGVPQLIQQALQQFDPSKGTSGLSPTASDAAAGKSPGMSDLAKLLGGGGGGDSTGGGAGLGAPSNDTPAYQAPSAPLFPRATAAAYTADAPVGTAGPTDPSASESPAGMPMGGGMGGGGAGGGQGGSSKEHKTAENLNSAENLNEAIGKPVRATNSVLDMPVKRRPKDKQ